MKLSCSKLENREYTAMGKVRQNMGLANSRMTFNLGEIDYQTG
jgi:hypothetical protein